MTTTRYQIKQIHNVSNNDINDITEFINCNNFQDSIGIMRFGILNNIFDYILNEIDSSSARLDFQENLQHSDSQIRNSSSVNFLSCFLIRHGILHTIN